MSAVEEKLSLLETKRAELSALFQKHRAGDTYDGDLPLQEVNDRWAELSRLNDDWETARKAEAADQEQKARFQELEFQNRTALDNLRSPTLPVPFSTGANGALRSTNGRGPAVEGKTLGELFIEHADFKGRPHVSFTVAPLSIELEGIDTKTLMTRTAGFPPETTRGPRLVYTALRRPVVADLIPQDPTTQSAIKYMEETTATNAAAPVAEGGAKPESALAYTERTQPVEKIATWLPATNEQLEDVPQLRTIIDDRLRVFLDLAEEGQLLTGSGTSPQLNGFLTKVTQAQAKGTDPTPTAIYKAFTLVRWTGFAEPSGIIIHPDDWTDIVTLQDTTGRYLYGDPSEVGPERLWGKPVVVTPAITNGTALTGDFALYSHISRRSGIRIEVSNSHGTYFVENKVAILAEERLSLEIYRSSAFAKVTGI